MDRAELIRERAYLLWEKAGRPNGREHEFWARAAEQIELEEGPAKDGRGENRFVAR